MTRDTEQRMKDISQAITERVPEGFGWLVMVWPMNDKRNYLTATNDKENAQRIWNNSGIGKRPDLTEFELK